MKRLHQVHTLSATSQRKASAHHPQTNGLTERLNKTIADMLSRYSDVEHRTWDAVLPYIPFAHNTAQQETTRRTPFTLLYGSEATTMLDAMLLHDITDEYDISSQQFIQHAEEARQLPVSASPNTSTWTPPATIFAAVTRHLHRVTLFGFGYRSTSGVIDKASAQLFRDVQGTSST